MVDGNLMKGRRSDIVVTCVAFLKHKELSELDVINLVKRDDITEDKDMLV